MRGRRYTTRYIIKTMRKLTNCQKVDLLSAVYPKLHTGLLGSLRISN